MRIVPKQKPEPTVEAGVSQGFETAGVVLVFLLIGLYLDSRFGTAPVLTLVLALFALVGQFTKMYLVYTQRMKTLEQRRADESSGRGT